MSQVVLTALQSLKMQLPKDLLYFLSHFTKNTSQLESQKGDVIQYLSCFSVQMSKDY